MAMSRAEKARNNLLEDIAKERGKSNPNKRVLARLQKQLTRIGGADVPAKSPDVLRVADRPTSPDVRRVANRPAKSPDVLRVADRLTSPDVRRVADRPTSPDVLRVADRLTSPDVRRVADRPTSPDVFIPSKRSTSGATPRAKPPVSRRPTSGATPRAKPPVSRRPTAGGNMMGGIPKGGGTLSKKDIDVVMKHLKSAGSSLGVKFEKITFNPDRNEPFVEFRIEDDSLIAR